MARTYGVSAEVTISIHTRVVARSKKEALRIAEERQLLTLCNQCADGNPDEEWCTSGELDGEPKGLKVAESEAIGYINVPGENTFIDKLIAIARHKKQFIVMADCNRTDKDGRCRGHRVLKESE